VKVISVILIKAQYSGKVYHLIRNLKQSSHVLSKFEISYCRFKIVTFRKVCHCRTGYPRSQCSH